MIKRILLIILVFTATYFILLPQTLNFCQQINRIDFDTQNLLVWDYLSGMGFKPYKDTFYPYGILFFNKSQSLPWYFTYTLISPTLLTIIFFTFINKLFLHWSIKLICYLGILTFVSTAIGVGSYARYGLIVSGAFLSVWLIYRFKSKPNLIPFLIGLLSGLVSFASGGEGAYLLLVQILIIIQFIVTKHFQQISQAIYPLFKMLALLFLGFAAGMIPLLLYLQKEQMIEPFFRFYVDMVYLSEVAKLPYLINNFHEVFIILSLAIGICSVTLLTYYPKTRRAYSTMLLSSAVFSLLLMQQKNILRPFGAQMDFYSIMLILVLISIVTRNKFKNYRAYVIKSIFLIIAFFLFFNLSLKLPFNFSFLSTSVQAYLPNNILNTLNLTSKLCRNESLDWGTLGLPQDYFQVINYLNAQVGDKSFITYPYNPIFYLLGNRQPAPYPNMYEAAPYHAQQKNIQYLIDNNIQYLIYQPPVTPIDWVPDYARTLIQTKYLLSQYQPVNVIGTFYILKKSISQNSSLFSPENAKKYPGLYNYYTKIFWGNIPLAEGLVHSLPILQTAKNIGIYENIDDLNQFLTNSAPKSDNLVLIPEFIAPEISQANMVITNERGQSTAVNFNIKAGIKHLIIPANLPLFFQDGNIAHIALNPLPSKFYVAVIDHIGDTWR